MRTVLSFRSSILAIILGGLLASSAAASKNQWVTVEAPRDLLNASSRDEALAELDGLGVHALRVVLYWKDVAPGADARAKPSFDASDPAGYDWSKYLPLLRAAHARGWKVILTITPPAPLWATSKKDDPSWKDGPNPFRPSPTEFGHLMTAISKGIGSLVDIYGIGNEPNHPDFLAPQYSSSKKPLAPAIYRELYAAGIKALDALGDKRPVLMGSTAPRGRGNAVPPLVFMRGVLCLNAKYQSIGNCPRLRTSGWAMHPYTIPIGPAFKPKNPDDVTIGSLSRLVDGLDRAAKAGAVPARLPIYITEFGIHSKPDPTSVEPLVQAEQRSIAEYMAWKNPRVASFSQYLLRDDEPDFDAPELKRYPGFETGLEYSTGVPKPSLKGFRLPLVVTSVTKKGRASLWGLVRPGSGARKIRLEISDKGRAFRRVAIVTTNAAGVWTHTTNARKGRRWRVRWAMPGGTVQYSPPTPLPKPPETK